MKGWFFNPGGRTELDDGVGETWSGLGKRTCVCVFVCERVRHTMPPIVLASKSNLVLNSKHVLWK